MTLHKISQAFLNYPDSKEYKLQQVLLITFLVIKLVSSCKKNWASLTWSTFWLKATFSVLFIQNSERTDSCNFSPKNNEPEKIGNIIIVIEWWPFVKKRIRSPLEDNRRIELVRGRNMEFARSKKRKREKLPSSSSRKKLFFF